LTDDPQAMGCCITFAPKQGSRSRRHRRVSGFSYALKTGRSRVTFDGNGSGNGIRHRHQRLVSVSRRCCRRAFHSQVQRAQLGEHQETLSSGQG